MGSSKNPVLYVGVFVVVAGVGALLWAQQRRLNQLEARAQQGAQSGEGAAGAGGVGPGGIHVVRVPVPVPVAAATPGGNPGGLVPSLPPGAGSVPGGGSGVPFATPSAAVRAAIAEKLATSPAAPESTNPAVRNFASQYGLNQGQWDAIVELNKEWQRAVRLGSEGRFTQMNEPFDKIAARREERIKQILDNEGAVKGFHDLEKTLGGSAGPSAEFRGKTYSSADIK